MKNEASPTPHLLFVLFRISSRNLYMALLSFGQYQERTLNNLLKGVSKMKKTLLIVAVVILALGALGVGVAFAQGGNPPSYPYGGQMMGGRGGSGGYGPVHDYVEQALASKLGLTEAQVETELATKPMAQIALDHGIAQADLAAFMNDIHKTAFTAAVKDGAMTQVQADFMLQRMSQNGYGTGTCPMGNGGYGRGGGMMGGWGRGQNQNQNP
jgi:hypothetical protein